MKKNILSPILFIAVCLLFSSCAQEFSGNGISKRHYRSGYYVAMNNDKPVGSKTNGSKKTISDVSTIAVEEIKETTNDNVVETEKTLNVQESALVTNAPAHNSKQGNSSTPVVSHKAKPIKTMFKNASKIKDAVASVKDVKKARRGDSSNLLLTILAILLILILVGAILGSLAGALIGLITLVLVIILVIWLLRFLEII